MFSNFSWHLMHPGGNPLLRNPLLVRIHCRRLTRLYKDELTREIMKTAIPMRMLLDTKRDGRLKARLVALGYREPKE